MVARYVWGMDEPEQRPYLAEWWPRVGATLLDSVIVGAISFGCLIVSILALAPFGADGDLGGPSVAAADADRRQRLLHRADRPQGRAQRSDVRQAGGEHPRRA